MSRRTIGIVYRKELRDLLRDRRTIVSMIVMPVIVMPLLMTGLGLAAVKLGGKVRQEIPKVMVLGGEDSPSTLAALRALNAFAFVPPSAGFHQPDFRQENQRRHRHSHQLRCRRPGGRAGGRDIYTYEGEFKSTIAAQSLEQFFRSRRDRIVGERLAEQQLPAKLLDALRHPARPTWPRPKSQRQPHRDDPALPRHHHVHDRGHLSLD